MNHVGKRYMTSKTVDLTTLKASPQFYGFQGQSLASLVEVSRVVNITSKTDQSEDTWEKSFQKGKEKDVLPSATRPSKGTTVDIKGFLYNLKIQKQAVNSLREIQNIKSFLECISLVHNNISISLRDNSKNEIIFQVNKCRNIYQTLATIFSLEKDKILELRVEKKCYGVTAYMGKVVSEENENHWVYLNGRFMPQCNLHHILDSNIAKLFNLKKQIKTKKLLKTACLEDEDVFKKHIPFYYVFITCPYDDYDFNTTSKQNTVEFKNWNEVTKLLDKLVQFYGGNVTTKENKIQTKQIGNKMESDTRDEVKKIMDRILKSNSRKLGISQLQNGVKGKIVKRCRKKNKNSSNKKNIDTSNQKQEKTDIINTADEKTDRDARILPIQIKTTSKLVQTELTPNHKNQRSNKKRIMSKRRIEKNISKEIDLNTNMKHQIAKQTSKVSTQHSDVLIRAFQHANSTMKKRCKLLSKNINKLQPFRKTRKNEVFSQYTIKTKNQHITVRKRVGKFVVHNVPAMPPKFEAITDDFCKKPVDKNLISSKDLLQTILPTQKQTIENGKEVGTYTPKIPCRNPQFKNPKYFENNIEAAIAPIKIMEVNERSCHGPQLTYDSHSYTKHATVDSHIGKSVDVMSGIVNTRFITKTSRDNFIGENDKSNLLQTKFKRNKSKKKQSVKYNTVKASVINELNEMKNSSYAIEFSNSNMDQNHNNYTKRMDKYLNFRDGSDISNLLTDLLQNGTCSLNRVSVFSERIEKSCRRFESSDFVENSYNATYTIRQYEEKQHHVPESNYPIIESISPNKEETEKDAMNKDNYEPNSQNDVNPLNICETVLSSPSMHYEAPGSMLTEDELIDLLNHQNTISNIQNESKSVVPNEDNYVNDGVIEDILSLPSDAMATCNAVEETSHHFNESKQTINKCASDKITYENVDKIRSPDHTTKTCNDMDEPGIIKTFKIDGNILRIHKETGMILENEVDDIRNNFQINVINRPRFVPKGMSQILGNRRRVHASDYYLDEDYFHENLYNEFNEAVETNTEIFEPNIDYVNNTTTKDIVKVNQKLSKDNASLNFDAVNLRAAELQGQVDDKFIAATIKGKTGQTGGLKKYLVLFDQHAVHERIRLESNLAG
ncbi:hypothetical protein JYU34_004054 [Plutella xylostella]|uniref:Uncharacterized protein n=1 Tax=Plutella xylostella TaxID=51655 RepID=A0ABQ7QX17_PLUXY|nr:hypothetical protein JYU34_004054 [Plutella xylostella]